MKLLLLIAGLGVLVFFWHQGQVDKLSSDLRAAQTELKQARNERDALGMERDVLRADREAFRSERDALRSECDALRTERDAFRTELDALKAPKPPKPVTTFDSSPMPSFSYGGMRLIEARIVEVNKTSVTVVGKRLGKNAPTVVIPLNTAIKLPELRMRAAQAMQAASEGE